MRPAQRGPGEARRAAPQVRRRQAGLRGHRMTLHEPAVALTDLGLALESVVFALLLTRGGRLARPGRVVSPRLWWAVFFGAVGAASALGAVVHGFLPYLGPARDVLWVMTLLDVGLAALAGYMIGARLLLRPGAARVVEAVAAGSIWVYAAVVLLGARAFGVAILYYLPAVLFLGAAFATDAARRRPGAAVGVAGIALTLVAAAVQQGRVALHPTYFDHNALYHLVQAVGLFLLFRAARATLARHEVKR
jgi:hypothetical protein